MQPAARFAAAIEVLDDWLAGTPAEAALSGWARAHRFAGSSDRRAIRDHVFAALRRKRMAAVFGGSETGRGLILGLLRLINADPGAVFTGEGHAPAPLTEAERAFQPPGDLPDPVRADWPDWLWPETVASLGDRVMENLELMKLQAGVHLRVNRARIDRDAAIAALAAEGFECAPSDLSGTALVVVSDPRRIAQSDAYQSGLVELQDAASQAVVDAVRPQKGERVLDYCAGGGGKALALAAWTGATVFAHDANPGRMKDLPNRAKRAGADIRTVADQAGIKGTFDLVFCDAPCSGSGSWRRDPEGKWRLDRDALARLNAVQDTILDTACRFVAPGGRLAYATCSLLACENRERIDAFVSRHPAWQCTLSRQFTPLDGGDGFYVAQLTRE